jgi:hypothetical protein
MVFSRASCPAFTITTNGETGILQSSRKFYLLPRIRQFLARAMEAAYLFGGGVALLACFQPFQDFRHPLVGVGQRSGSKFATSLI